jgi:hypothetical protein
LLRAVRWLLLLVIVCAGLLFIPAVFQFAIRQAIAFQAWRSGGEVQIAEITGTLTGEPIALVRSQWNFRSNAGTVTRVEIERAVATFSWKELLPANGGTWFRQLTLEGVSGKVTIPVDAESAPARERERTRGAGPFDGWPTPATVEAREVDLLFQKGEQHVWLRESRWRVSELERGTVEIGELSVKQPWLNRTFRDVHATTAIQESRLVLANLELEKGVEIESFRVKLPELAHGRLDLGLELVAFGGRVQFEASPIVDRHEDVEANAFVRQEIQIAPLATFFGLSDAAGGTIKSGNFTFRGSPRDPAKAMSTLRLEATNFQWETRQWDSLVLGVTLIERRLQVPELVLRQGHNHLTLNGEMALPTPGIEWWKSDFACNVNGEIENLTELSALLLPEFQYTSGQLTVDGSVRAKDQQFSGHLIVSGKEIAWRNTPIQELRGAIRLAGKEVQIASLDLLNRDDYLHGQGVVDLGGGGYRGDFRASVEDFGRYASLLEVVSFPTPVTGGAVLRWTGQGTAAKGHSGRFFARLQKLRPLRAEGTYAHPVDAEVEGSYEPGKTIVSRLSLADDECSFSAQAELTAQTLRLSELQLRHGAQVWLAGEALLPREYLHDYFEPAAASPPSGAPFKLRLTASGLSLKHAARLTGWNWPVEGFVEGEIAGEGVAGKLALSGRWTLVNGRIPIGWNGDALDDVRGELHATGQTLSFLNGTAQHRTGKYTGSFQVDLANYANPTITAEARCERALFPLFEVIPKSAVEPSHAPFWCDAAVALQASGPLAAAVVKGEVRPDRIRLTEVPAIGFLWGKTGQPVLAPAPFTAATAPFERWKLQITANTDQPARMVPGEGELITKLTIRGTGQAPELAGTCQVQNMPAHGGALSLTVKNATLNFSERAPRDPMIDLQATGISEHFPFSAYILGPLSNHMSFADSPEALGRLRAGPGAGIDLAPLQSLEQPGLLHGTTSIPWAPIAVPSVSAKPAPERPAVAPPVPKPE